MINWRGGGVKSNCQMWRCGTPHCPNVDMWWSHIVNMWICGGSTLARCGYVVNPHFKCGSPNFIRIYPRINVNLHYGGQQYTCIYSHLKCGHSHCFTTNPHRSSTHPHSKCGDVVGPHYIHILRVKVNIASTPQAVWIPCKIFHI